MSQAHFYVPQNVIRAVEGGLELATLLPQPLRYLVLDVTWLQDEKAQHTLTLTAIIKLKIHLRSDCAHVVQKRHLDPHPGAGGTVFVVCLMWVLGPKLRSSPRVVCFYLWILAPALSVCLTINGR